MWKKKHHPGVQQAVFKKFTYLMLFQTMHLCIFLINVFLDNINQYFSYLLYSTEVFSLNMPLLLKLLTELRTSLSFEINPKI